MIKKYISFSNKRYIKKFHPILSKINQHYFQYKNLEDDAFKDKTKEFKERINSGEKLDDILPEAFALVKEASKRVLNMPHYAEQLIGGIILHQGRVAEIKTGEGKTLVATLPSYLNALTGKSVHIVTANDYLAKRDSEFVKPLFEYLGLTVDHLALADMHNKEKKKEQYSADILYGIHSEFAFDYLRDNLVYRIEDKVQKDLSFVIIDEIDSILIDDAKTPLIISGFLEDDDTYIKDLYLKVHKFVKTLDIEKDVEIELESKHIILTPNGVEKAEHFFNFNNYSEVNNHEVINIINQSLRANYILKEDKDYIVSGGKVKIIDSSTGRILEGREFSNHLHQMLEVKEGIDPSNKTSILATITYQNFFTLYKKLSGMSGTVFSSEEEFKEIYKLDVVRVPTHKPIQRIDREDIIYNNYNNKIYGLLKEIEVSYKKQQPVLIGSSSVQETENLSALLNKYNIKHKVLNAKSADKEAEIISKAGKLGAITIATNMAGRGTDIKVDDEALLVGGLKVIGTTRNESKRIDDQLKGRSGRQGDVGESVFIIALDDDIIKESNNAEIEIFKKRAHLFTNMPISDKFSNLSEIIDKIQNQTENMNYEYRKDQLKFESVINNQRQIIYDQRNDILNYSLDDLNKLIFNILNEISENISIVMKSKENIHDSSEFNSNIKGMFSEIGIDLEDSFFENINNDTINSYIYNMLKNKYLYLKLSSSTESFLSRSKHVVLSELDKGWIEHINNMEIIKINATFKALKAEDPICNYTLEGGKLFNDTILEIKKNILKKIFSINL